MYSSGRPLQLQHSQEFIRNCADTEWVARRRAPAGSSEVQRLGRYYINYWVKTKCVHQKLVLLSASIFSNQTACWSWFLQTSIPISGGEGKTASKWPFIIVSYGL